MPLEIPSKLKYSDIVIILLLIWELLLNTAIVSYIPYTEIDWRAYMQQAETFLAGERNYLNIRGDTGPLVYPAGFLYIFSGLRWLTKGGDDILMAQYIFAALYVFSFGIVCLIYRHSGKIPPLILITLTLSKRLHSIYALRLFNDPVAMFFLYLSVLFILRNRYLLSVVLMSLALSIKMNILLFAPGYALVLLVRRGLAWSLIYFLVFISVQIVIGSPFLLEYPYEYISRSFDLSRVFLYQWTVNWKSIDEETFLNPLFSRFLLVCHAVFLLVFMFWKWSDGNLLSLLKNSLLHPWQPFSTCVYLDNYKIIYILFTSQFIGVCFSRSLHYQFYSWYFWTLPFLLWHIFHGLKMGWKIFYTLLILALIEISWNVYPSTSWSSAILQSCHFIILFGLLISGSKTSFSKQEQNKLN